MKHILRNRRAKHLLPFILFFFAFSTFNYAYATNGSGTASVVVTPLTSPLVNTTTNKLVFTYTAAETLSGGGISISVPSTWSTPQGISSTAGYTTVSTTGTVGIVFDEAEVMDNWTTNGSACSTGLTVDTFHHSGTKSLKCINNSLPSGDGPGGKYYNNLSATQDWSQYTTVGFWIYTDTAISNGRLAFEYSTTDGLANQIETRLSLGSLVPAGAWTHVFFTFTGLPASRTAVKSYGFEITNNSVKGSTIYVDGFSIGASNSSFVPGFSGRDIIVNAISLNNTETITVTYGDSAGAGRSVAPSAPEASLFTVKSRTDESSTLTTLSNGSSPTVNVIDTTAPTAALTAPTASTIHGNAVTLAASVSDNVAVAGVKYYFDNVLLGSEVTTPFTSTFDSTSKSDGAHSIIVVARDTSSNYATSSAVSVTVDNTGPTISAIASTTAATTATVTWSTNESANSKVSYGTVSGTYTANTSSASLVTSHSVGLISLSQATTYYYVVVSADASGNTSTSTEKTLRTLDATAPSVSLTAPINGATLIGSSISLAATASDNVAVAGVKFYIDGTLIGSEDTDSPFTATLDSTTKSDGSHSIVAVARDTSNNFATSTAATVTIENTAPTVAITYSPTHAVKSGDSLTITATFNEAMADSPVPKIAISGANTLSATNMTKVDSTHYTYVFTVGAGNGAATVALSTGTDIAGNVIVGTPTSGATFTVDNSAPSAPTITSIATDNMIGSGELSAIHVVGTAEADALVSVTLSDGVNSKTGTQQLSGGATAFDITIDGTAASPSAFVDGTITPGATATDAAGNVSGAATTPTAEQSSIIADTTAPSVSMTAPLSGAYVRGSSVSLAATASDDSGVAGVKFYIGTPPVLIGSEDVSSPFTGTFDSTSKVDGSYTIIAVARDTSNNFATSTGRTFIVDNTAPVVSSVTFSPTSGAVQIGETLTATITADAPGYTANSITINGVAVSTFHDNSDGTYTVTYIVQGGDTQRAQNAQIPISVVLQDAAGNTNAAFTTSPTAHNSPAVTISDHTKPDVTVNQESSQSDPTSSTPVLFDVVWSEVIDTDSFTTADISQDGTASGITWEITDTGDHMNFVLSATALSGSGTIKPSIGSGAVDDLYGNSNNSSSATDNTVTYLTGAPVISDITARPSSSGAMVRWTTDQDSSSQVRYGLLSSVDSSTVAADTVTGVTSHSVSLSSLVSCSTYHYKVVSTNAIANTTTSSDGTFTTRDCAGDSDVGSQTSSLVTSGAGGTLSLLSGGKGLTLTIPSLFGGSDSVFQIKKLNKTVSLGALHSPSGYQAVGDYVYDLHALPTVTSAMTNFSRPLTVTLAYAVGDLGGAEESSLKIYRNDSSVWTMLSNCTVDQTAKTVTCETDHFSTFSIFGVGATVASNDATTQSVSSGGSGTHFGCKDPKALNYDYFASSDSSLCKYGAAKTQIFSRNLNLGMSGDDVLVLQKFLNAQGFVIASTGPGSSGQETGRFGKATKAALIKFQKAKGISPALGSLGPKTRKAVNEILSSH